MEGFDIDYPDRPPDIEKLRAGLAFAAMVESVADHFLAGAEPEEMTLVGWIVGLRSLRNELTWKARLVAQGEDPRERELVTDDDAA